MSGFFDELEQQLVEIARGERPENARRGRREWARSERPHGEERFREFERRLREIAGR